MAASNRQGPCRIAEARTVTRRTVDGVGRQMRMPQSIGPSAWPADAVASVREGRSEGHGSAESTGECHGAILGRLRAAPLKSFLHTPVTPARKPVRIWPPMVTVLIAATLFAGFSIWRDFRNEREQARARLQSVAELRATQPSWPSLLFQAMRELWAALRNREPAPAARAPRHPSGQPGAAA